MNNDFNIVAKEQPTMYFIGVTTGQSSSWSVSQRTVSLAVVSEADSETIMSSPMRENVAEVVIGAVTVAVRSEVAGCWVSSSSMAVVAVPRGVGLPVCRTAGPVEQRAPGAPLVGGSHRGVGGARRRQIADR